MKEGPTRSRDQQHELRTRRTNTKKLEEDNKKMELRLQELKLAMNREKEERQSKDGGFWGKGQTGTLLNYKVESSKKQPSKAKRVGVLKDEVIVAPKRPAQPGTMAYIAQQDPAARSSRTSQKVKTAKCGQCEEKSAAVTCQECGEDYCTKCFAVFHLKGALRKHRTIPITSLTPRTSSARQLFTHQTSTDNGTGYQNETPALTNQMMRQEDAIEPVETGSVAGGPSSKQPESARDEARQMIQEMMRSQQRKTSQDSNETPRREVVPDRTPTKPTVHFDEDFDEEYLAHDIGVGNSARFDNPFPIQRQQVEVSDCKIGTDDPVSRILLGQHPTRDNEDAAPEINFTHALSYGERLMLKQHRRRQIDQIQEGYLELQQPIRREDELRLLARQQALQTKRNNQLAEDFPEVAENNDRIDFQALCDLTQMAMNPEYINGAQENDVNVLEMAFVDRVEIREDDFLPRIRPPPSAENRRRQSNNSASNAARLRRYQTSKTSFDRGAPEIKGQNTEASGERRLSPTDRIKTAERMSLTLESVTPTAAAELSCVTPSPVPRLPSGSSRRAKMTPTPRSARRIPEVPRPASRRSDSARRVHNLVSKPTDGLRAVVDHHQLTQMNNWMPFDFSDSISELPNSNQSRNRAPISARKERPASARTRPGSAAQLSNRFYNIGPRAWRPDSSVPTEEISYPPPSESTALRNTSPADLPSLIDGQQIPDDITAEIDAIEALAKVQKGTFAAPQMLQSSQGPKMALRGMSLSSFRATSRASTSLTAVTSESGDSECFTGRQSIVVEGDDYSSYDQLRNHEEESDDDNAQILALEDEIVSKTGERSRLDSLLEVESSKSSDQYQLDDSLEMRRSFSAECGNDSLDSLDSLDTARYDDAGEVRDLQ